MNFLTLTPTATAHLAAAIVMIAIGLSAAKPVACRANAPGVPSATRSTKPG